MKPRQPSRLQEGLECLWQDPRDRRTAGGFDALEVVSPPRSSTPVNKANPHATLLHTAKSTLDGRNASVVRASAHLSKDTLEVVLLEPVSCCADAFSTDGGRDTGWASSRTVAVKILMHLCDNCVVRSILPQLRKAHQLQHCCWDLGWRQRPLRYRC